NIPGKADEPSQTCSPQQWPSSKPSTWSTSPRPPSTSPYTAMSKNAPFLQQQLLAGNTDFEYAFIDASVIVSRIHVLSAVYRAINALHSHRLRSRNVHSEIVFSLSPNNNIAESFRRFGITATTENLLVVKVGGDREEVRSHLEGAVEGEAVGFEEGVLKGMLDVGRVRKVYKLNSGGGGGKKGSENRVVNEE
ncbi:EKC/KEOPS complex subunit, partial [Lachnellula subtilissima]